MILASPISPQGYGAFLLAVVLSACQGVSIAADIRADPFLTRDQNPFTLVYGQPLPTPARLPRDEQLNFAFSLDIANTLNVESTGSESLYADFEAYHLTLGGIYGLGQNWALKLDLPFIYRSGGVFDHAIDEWHKFFGLPRASRPAVADDEFRVRYTSGGETRIDLDASRSGIADIQVGLGRRIYQTEEQALSLWAAIDLPAGETGDLTGNDDLDYAVWLAGSSRVGQRSMLDTNLGIVLPGDSILPGLQTEPVVGFGHAGAHIGLTHRLALKLQLAGHTGYYRETELDFLGSAVVIVFGGAINIGRCSALDIGFSEDITVGASPDASLLISWKSQTGC